MAETASGIGHPSLRGYAPAFLAALLFATAAPAGKALLAGTGPLSLAGLFYLGAALGVLPVLAGKRRLRSPLAVSPRNRTRLLGAIAAGGILAPVAFLLALRLAAAVSVSLWLNLEAVATAVLGALFFHDRLGRRGWIAVLGVVVGGVVLAAGESEGGAAAAGLVALACVLWGLDNNWTALVDELTPMETVFWKGSAAAVVNLGLAATLGEGIPGLRVTVLALLVGALAYGASIALYIRSAQLLGAVRSQLVFASAPFLGAILAAVFLGESLGMRHAAAAALFAVSYLALAAERHAHVHVHEALAHEHAHRHDDGHHLHEHPGLAPETRHTHRHRHEPLVHAHPHVPDLHHRHPHPSPDGDPVTGGDSAG